MNKDNKNTWTTLGSKLIYDNPWINLVEHDVLNPAGKKGIYSVVNFKGLAIGVLPLDEDKNTWLVGQWRYPLGQYSWEIPEGGGKLDVDPIESAKRELKEETGLIAENYHEICKMHTSNSVCNETAIIYLATCLSQSEAEPEETEDIKIMKLPFDKAYKMVLDGEITDSLSMVAILKTKIWMDEGKI
jgi:ADP-ribose pyrophosphatase